MKMFTSMEYSSDSKYQKLPIWNAFKEKTPIKLATQMKIYLGINLTKHIKEKIILKHYRKTMVLNKCRNILGFSLLLLNVTSISSITKSTF